MTYEIEMGLKEALFKYNNEAVVEELSIQRVVEPGPPLDPHKAVSPIDAT